MKAADVKRPAERQRPRHGKQSGADEFNKVRCFYLTDEQVDTLYRAVYEMITLAELFAEKLMVDSNPRTPSVHYELHNGIHGLLSNAQSNLYRANKAIQDGRSREVRDSGGVTGH